MRRRLAIAALAGTLLAGGTAVAATGGRPFFGGDRGERDAELARDLAQRLDGVSADQIQKALEDVRHDRQAEWRKEQAAALAKHLDGVSTAQVEKAFEKVQGDVGPPTPGRRGGRHRDVVAALAKELGKSESDVRKAFQAAHKERFDAMLDKAVKDGRLTEKQADRIRKRMAQGPPPFFRDGPGPGRGRHFHGGPGMAGPGGPPGPPPDFR